MQSLKRNVSTMSVYDYAAVRKSVGPEATRQVSPVGVASVVYFEFRAAFQIACSYLYAPAVEMKWVHDYSVFPFFLLHFL